MFSARWVGLCALAISFVPSFASADESQVEAARRRVEEGLVKPLAEKENERSKFSRARPMPRERRVRVTEANPSNDKNGDAFMTFAVDLRFQGSTEWSANDIVGCTYVKTGAIFVKRNDEYRPAEYLLGKDVAAVPGVCAAAPRAKAS